VEEVEHEEAYCLVLDFSTPLACGTNILFECCGDSGAFGAVVDGGRVDAGDGDGDGDSDGDGIGSACGSGNGKVALEFFWVFVSWVLLFSFDTT
jgi:hypothetical protein